MSFENIEMVDKLEKPYFSLLNIFSRIVVVGKVDTLIKSETPYMALQSPKKDRKY